MPKREQLNSFGREQVLIDIILEVAIRVHHGHTIKGEKWAKNKTTEEIAKWVTGQLRCLGWDTEPCGASWAVLKDETEHDVSNTNFRVVQPRRS